MSLVELSAKQLLAELDAGRATAVEATQAYLERIARYDKHVGAFLRVDAEGALAKASEIDGAAGRGNPSGGWLACRSPSKTSFAAKAT